MATVFSRKNNADMLALIQGFYPTVTAFTWNLDGSATVTSDVMTQGMSDDIIQIVSGKQSWQAN